MRANLLVLDLSHLPVDVHVLLELVQLLLLRARRALAVLRVVARFGQLVRHLVERRLQFGDVVFQLPDSRDLLRDDRRRRRRPVARDAADVGRRCGGDLELVVGARLLADDGLQRRDLLLSLPDLCVVLGPANGPVCLFKSECLCAK